MSTRHLVDPELLALLDVIPPFAALSPESLATMRLTTQQMAKDGIAATDLRGVTWAEVTIPGTPSVRALMYRPPGFVAPGAAFLHIHGGGMIVGSPDMSHATSVDTALTHNCIVLSVDYRLAPEHPFPAAIEDCYAALVWLHAHDDVDSARVAIGGDSAGGGLAASLAILNRERRRLPITAQMLKYPMLDHRTVAPDYEHPFAGEYVWAAATNQFGWDALLGKGRPVQQPGHASPAVADDLTGLPPAFIAVGALDLFVEEDIEYARRLIRAGVPTELHVYPGAFHAFDMQPQAAVTKSFRTAWTAFLSRALAGGGSKTLQHPPAA